MLSIKNNLLHLNEMAANARKIVWTNPNPRTAIANGTTINYSENINDYDFLIVTFRHQASNERYITRTIDVETIRTEGSVVTEITSFSSSSAANPASGTPFWQMRLFTFTSSNFTPGSGIYWTNLNAGNTANSANLFIPQTVTAFKLNTL